MVISSDIFSHLHPYLLTAEMKASSSSFVQATLGAFFLVGSSSSSSTQAALGAFFFSGSTRPGYLVAATSDPKQMEPGSRPSNSGSPPFISKHSPSHDRLCRLHHPLLAKTSFSLFCIGIRLQDRAAIVAVTLSARYLKRNFGSIVGPAVPIRWIQL